MWKLWNWHFLVTSAAQVIVRNEACRRLIKKKKNLISNFTISTLDSTMKLLQLNRNKRIPEISLFEETIISYRALIHEIKDAPIAIINARVRFVRTKGTNHFTRNEKTNWEAARRMQFSFALSRVSRSSLVSSRNGQHCCERRQRRQQSDKSNATTCLS